MRRTGFTLVETLIAAGIGVLLLIAVAQIFESGAHLFQRGLARSDLQGGAMRVAAAVQRTLQDSEFESITIATDANSGQVLLSCRPLSAGGGFVAFAYNVRPAELDQLPIANAASRLAATDIGTAMASATAATGLQVLARDVSRFTVTPTHFPDPTLRDPNLTLDVVLQQAGVTRASGGGETVQNEVNTTLLPRDRI